MNWILLALAGAWAVGGKTTVDKAILRRGRPNYFTLTFAILIVPCILFTIAATLMRQWGALANPIFLGAAAGNIVCVMTAELSYISCIDHHDASAVESIKSLIPIFVGIFAFIFLGESLSWITISGIGIATVGCYYLEQSRTMDHSITGVSTSFWGLMAIVVVMTAGATSFSRLALQHGEVFVYVATRFLVICPLLLLMGRYIKLRGRETKRADIKLMLFSGLLLTLSDFFEFSALSVAKAAHVEAVRKSSILFVLLLEFLFLGRIINTKRILAGSVLFIGVVLVALGSYQN